MVKPLAALLLTAGWINASAAETDTISYESLVPAGSPCDTTSRERDRISQPVERIANFVMIVSNKGHCAHHMSFQEVDVIASELITECEWVQGDPEFGCHIVMVNDKWVARASDFKYLATARIRWNQRTHTLKRVQTMTLNQRADLLTRGEIDHNLAFGNFDFTAALSKDEIPNFGVVELTQYGRDSAPLLPNPWQNQDRSRIVRQLAQEPGAIFVAPIRTIGYGLNAAHRKAVSLRLARQISKTTGRRVHDPLLIQRAFGAGVRSVSVKELFQMAYEVGAAMIVIPEIGHDNANGLVMRSRIAALPTDNSVRTAPPGLKGRRTFTSNANLVADIGRYGVRIGKFLNQRLGRKQGASTVQRTASNRIDTLIPAVDALARDERTARQAIAQYQWLGALVPDSDPDLRSELYARSLVLLIENENQAQPIGRLLMARALAEIGALPAARAITQSSQRPALNAYREFTLGRYQAMQAALNKMRPTAAYDLLQTDRIRLLRSIGQSDAAWPIIQVLSEKHPSWESLLRQKVDSQRLVESRSRSSDCQNAQFCPKQALSLVSDALAVDAVINAIRIDPTSERLSGYIADFDTVLAGNPVYEQAVLRVSSTALRGAIDKLEQGQLRSRITVAQDYLRTGLEFSDSELLQPGKTYQVVMFPAHKYRRANDQDFPPVFSNGRAYQYSRFAQGAGLIDYFFFRMPGQRGFSDPSDRVNATR